MNCEVAQRTIALAALAPAQSRHPGIADADRDPELAALEAEIFAAHPELTDCAADLPDAERVALEEHLAGCRECQAEMAATSAFYRALSLARQPEPSPSLVARARLRLDATLDQNAHQSVLAHLLQQLSFSAGRLRASPGLASALLLVGLVAGGYGGYRAGRSLHNVEQRELPSQVIASVNSIVRDPDSEQVEVRYNRLVPDVLSGSLDDPWIRRLLVLGIQNGADQSVRNNSVDLLADECRHGHQCNGGLIRTALLNALRKDRDPRVRLQALDGLEPYIAEDVQVRDAVVRALMADSSANVRIDAIRLLTPVEVDSSVRRALHTAAAEDRDPSIRSASQQMLNGMPQVQ
ncbi:MAG TPA: HEAT repeat domain-containing protein [Acidobacteriaceae bacterium]